MTNFLENIKQNSWRNWHKAILLVLIIITLAAGISVMANYYKISKTSAQDASAITQAKEVKVMHLDSGQNLGLISTQGTVKAVSKVDILAQANGTVKSINFKIGDQVSQNQPLINLADDLTATNYTNASQNYNNIQQSAGITRQLTDELIIQAQLGVKRAQETLDAAHIGLKASQDNLDNTKNLQDKTRLDQRNNAIKALTSFTNSIKNTLDQINYIIKAEGDSQLPGINLTLSVKDLQKLDDARNLYVPTKNDYKKLAAQTASSENIIQLMHDCVNILDETKILVDLTMTVLDNTIPHSAFNDNALSAQKNSLSILRGTVINTQTGALNTLQGLENFDLSYKQALDNLTNARDAAQNQYNQALIGYDNAISSLNNAKKSRDQQLILSQTTLDNARGQLNLVGTQLNDLTVKSPIAGQITGKSVDIGTEVRIGQKVAEVSQLDLVKILVQLNSQDAANVKMGQAVTINKTLTGQINRINPTADPTNKKQEIEIIFENKNHELVPETFASVEIPTDKISSNQDSSYYLPLKAITIGQNENYVFTIKDNKATMANVDILSIEGETALVKINLAPDSLIIIDGNKLLEEGDTVSIVK